MYNLSRYNYYIQTLVDVIALFIGFNIAFALKPYIPLGPRIPIDYVYYLRLLNVSVLLYAVVNFMVLANEETLTKSFGKELRSAFQTVFLVFSGLTVYLFVINANPTYSRVFVVLFMVSSQILMILMRTLVKNWMLPLYRKSKNAEKIIFIGRREKLEKLIQRFKKSNDWRIWISGAVLTDEETEIRSVEGIKVLCHYGEFLEKVPELEADSCFFAMDQMDAQTAALIEKLIDEGKRVHLNLDEFELLQDRNRMVDVLGSSTVITYFPSKTPARRTIFIKRVIETMAAIVLLPLLLVFYLLSLVFMNIESPGPVFIRRIRIGKNGRRFYQHRFRIMRMDAQERIRNGRSPYMFWGRFLRLLHIDGMAEILDVLTGDMSICGPYAPSVTEYLQYSGEMRRNLGSLPGIVGKWCCIEDEKDALQKEINRYENMSLTGDCMTVLETVFRYLLHRSLRKDDAWLAEEEIQLIQRYRAAKQPMEYDYSAYTKKDTAGVRVYLLVKRLIDIVLSLAGIVVLFPVLLILSIAVMADDGGSPFYRHERIGYRGKRIQILKFRSMRQNAGSLEDVLTAEQLEQYRKEFKVDEDPRITKVGAFIRRFSLDELPQLFNILTGDISIVGPRPIVEEETKIYGRDVAKLLSVKPGLTGYWQAYARNNATYESGERQAMEMYYVDHAGLLLDIKIFFHTFARVLSGDGAQ